MTSRSTWKRFERTVAEFFGTHRTPLSGSSAYLTRADTMHLRLFIECKLRKRSSVWNLFQKVKGKAAMERKTPVLALKQKGCEGWLIVLDIEDLEVLKRELRGE